jgi:hypothetical protein
MTLDSTTDKRPAGRPTSFKPEYAEQAFKLCLLGATDEDMADFFNVCMATINNWKNDHPKFLEALSLGKIRADAEIAHSLYHRAKGYEHPAVKIFMPQGAAAPVYADYIEHYPPDVAAAKMWLFNRQPKKWKPDQTEDGGNTANEIKITVVGGFKDE